MATEPRNRAHADRGLPAEESYVRASRMILLLYLLGFFPGLLANVLKLRQATRTKRLTGQDPPGYGCLNALMIGGAVGLVALILLCMSDPHPHHLIWPPEGQAERAQVSRVRAAQRSLATAIEAYKLDHGVYPAYTFDRRESVGAQTAAEFEARHGRVPTFRTRGTTELRTLTTPIGYISSIFGDALLGHRFRDHGYAYWTDGGGWMIWSPGPDGEYAIKDPSELYSSGVPQPSETLLLRAYDPTNGTISPGDIFRVAQ